MCLKTSECLLVPTGSLFTEDFTLAALEAAFATFGRWMDGCGDGRRFFMGEEMCYADVTVASFLIWIRVLYGEESEEWKRMEAWDKGRWARLLAAMEKYSAVDEGEDVQL